MKKRPLSAVERLARLIEKSRAERVAKYDRALAEYNRINARLRARHYPAASPQPVNRTPAQQLAL